MTIGEAIYELETNVDYKTEKIKKACQIAIKALEQQPCEDCISRQAAIDIIERWLSCDDYNEAERHIMRAMQSVLYDLYDLPSVTPKSKSEYEHDHDVVKAYNDGQAYILDKIRAEIEEIKLDVDLDIGNEMIYNNAIKDVLEIIDKYRGGE